jgi:hypothetical protein
MCLVFFGGLFAPSALTKMASFIALVLLMFCSYFSLQPKSVGVLNTIKSVLPALYAPLPALAPSGDFRIVEEHVGFWLMVAFWFRQVARC